MKTKEKILEDIIHELCGRKGFDDWWYDIDEDIQEEIIETLLKLF